MKTLDPWTMPFAGMRLIEASAGTGKTYTLVNLYLRAIIGHTQTASATPLRVDQILVVTFTDAATEELKDRIRKKIFDVKHDLLQQKSEDLFIKKILQLPNQKQIIQLLKAAEQQFDEAAIFTIHGFCKRILKQYAFKSGLLFSCDLDTDNKLLLGQATADFWRQYMATIEHSEDILPLIWQCFKTPDDLLATIKSILFIEKADILPTNLPANWQEFFIQYVQPALDLKKYWQDNPEIIQLLLNSHLSKSSKSWKRINKLQDFLVSDLLLPVFTNSKAEDNDLDWDAYSTDAIIKNTKKNKKPPLHDGMNKVDEWLKKTHRVHKCVQAMIIRDAINQIKIIFYQLKTEQQKMDFDDLLINLAKGLGVHSTVTDKHNGDELAATLREQYPLAMIDEFQDTDNLQYAIFNKVYQSSNTTMLMIGDPKQAIYAFRGADIFTYLKAKHETVEQYTLDTNWRSSATMIDAVNTLFSQTENPFLFKQDISFYKVNAAAAEKTKVLIYKQQEMPALRVWYHDKTITKKEYERKIATKVAYEITKLLNSAQTNNCYILNKNKTTDLKQNDIAILVKDKSEAKIIKEALKKYNINSIYLSSRQSVFASEEAMDILRILLACESPASAKKTKAALASSILLLTVAEIEQQIHNDDAWYEITILFNMLQKIWFEQGPLVMLQTLIKQYNIVAKLHNIENGERKLTNFYHLAQLVENATEQEHTPKQLIRWLEIQIHNFNNDDADQQLHLENEQELVKIITIHKSKGLEYPVVFIPFVALHWGKTNKETCMHHENADKNAQIMLISDEQDKKAQAKEQLAESLRLLYVALTRAASCCYIAAAPVTKGNSNNHNLKETAIGYLLKQENIITEAELEQLLQTIASKTTVDNAIAISNLVDNDEDKNIKFMQQEIQKPQIIVQQFTSIIEKNWQLSSYTSLTKNLQTKYQPSPTAIILTDNQEKKINYNNISDFPKGSKAGIFLHALFENMHYITQLTTEKKLTYIEKKLIHFNYDTNWTNAILTLLDSCMSTYLIENSRISLADIPQAKQKCELDFCISSSLLKSNELNDILIKYDPLSAKADALEFTTVKGMLRGFIDLIFEHNNRWYLVDYKSNWLGDDKCYYNLNHMEQAMIEHRYDLQYQIYSLALHRLLKQKLPDYDFESHFGGVFYLFIRGITSTSEDNFGIYRCKPSNNLIFALDSLLS